MKKTLSWLLCSILAFTLFAFSLTASAATNFTDNFSSGKVEDRWTNGYIDGRHNSAVNPDQRTDSDQVGVAEISGGVLNINNKDTGGSFFYISPRNGDIGIQAKNFTVSMKVKFEAMSDAWVGFSTRKSTNDRFNGCDNVLICFRLGENSITMQANRSYGGGDVMSINTKFTENTPFTGDPMAWHTYKLVVQDNLFTGYVDDFKVGTLDYSSKTINDAGFISLNACLAKVKIDDFSFTSSENQPSPAASSGSASSKAAGTSSAGPAASSASKDGNTSKNQGNGSGANTVSADSGTSEEPGTSAPDSTESLAGSEAASGGAAGGELSSAKPTGQDGAETGGLWWVWILVTAVILGGGAAVYIFAVRPKLQSGKPE